MGARRGAADREQAVRRSAVGPADHSDGNYYLPTTYDRRERAPESSTYCLCSPMPQAIPAGEGVELYGYYPALPAGVTSVTVQIAGLPDIANVPVTKVG